jgi:hypothetical protein
VWILLSQSNIPFIGKSRGRMYYVNNNRKNYYTLMVWIFQGDNKWISEHTNSHGFWTQVCAHFQKNCGCDPSGIQTILFAMTDDKKLMLYNMDH